MLPLIINVYHSNECSTTDIRKVLFYTGYMKAFLLLNEKEAFVGGVITFGFMGTDLIYVSCVGP